MTEIILVGGGGHCRSCIDVIEACPAYEIRGIVDRASGAGDLWGYPLLGDDSTLPELVRLHGGALVTVGQIATPEPRMRIFRELVALGAHLPVVVSPRAHVSTRAEVGPGSAVMHFAVVNAGATVGDNCIINTRALVEHDAQIAGHCHISTGAIVNGGCVVGEGTFIGSGAILHQGVTIGAGCVIAAGAVVRTDVQDGTTVRVNR